MERKIRNLDVTRTSMDKIAVNNLVVSMRSLVQRCKSRAINKLSRQIKNYRNRKGPEEKQEKMKRKAERLVGQIMTIKKLDKDKTAQFCLSCTKTVKQAENERDDVRAMTRVASDSAMQEFVLKWRSEHSDWEELAGYLHERITRRLKKKAKKMEVLQTLAIPDGVSQKSTEIIQPDITDKTMVKSSVSTDKSSENVKKLNEKHKSSENVKKLTEKDKSGENVKELTEKDKLVSKLTTGVVATSPSAETLSDDATSDRQISENDSGSSDTDSETADVVAIETVNKTRVKSEIKPTTKVTPSAKDDKKALKPTQKTKKTLDKSSSKSDAATVTTKKSPTMYTKPITSSNPLMVVKELDLNELEDDVEITLVAEKSAVAKKHTESTSQADGKPTSKDPFFLFNDEDEDDGGCAGPTEVEDMEDEIQRGSIDDDDDEDTVPGMSGMRMESMFVGNLSSSRDLPNVHRRPRVNQRSAGPHHSSNRHPQHKSDGRFSNFRQKEEAFPRKTNYHSGNTNTAKPPSHHNNPPQAAKVSDNSSEKIHPSWEASKKRKMEATIQSFSGKKTTFDD